MIKNTKRILVSFALILIVLVLLFQGIKIGLSPNYSGTEKMAGLTETVPVFFDSYGIPHIYATNEVDAFKALGYVHAQDRLWQMEVLRRIGAGRLSELFGVELLETDKLFLTLGIDAASEKAVAQLEINSEVYKLSNAYLEGVNAFISNGPTPVEFYLTGIEKKDFELKDIYNTVGYMAFSFAVAQRTDPLLSQISQDLGAAYLKDLSIDYDPNTVAIVSYKGVEDQIASLLEKIPAPQFIGSNAWVIGREKTKRGQVIFANDPHIGYSQPSVWYEAHLKTPNYENYGFHLAGVPFPLLAHNRKLAYGLTMFENDDIDFYTTQTKPNNPDQYLYEDQWISFSTLEETIYIKDTTPVSFKVKSTRHGPVMNEVIGALSDQNPLSMSWVYTLNQNKVLHALYDISHAKEISDFNAALPNIHAPGLNIMYGDAKGNVAWWATAALYELPEGLSSKFILDGSTKATEKIAYLPFSENPKSVNPPWNYVYSANNAPKAKDGITYPGYYLPENRAKRIETLLKPKNDWDLESASEMMLDHTSSVNPTIVSYFMKSIKEDSTFYDGLNIKQKEALDKMALWKGDYPETASEPALFHKWEYYFLKNIFVDELGEEKFKAIQSTHFFKRSIAPFAALEKSIWFDILGTTEKETKEILVQRAFITAFEDLSLSFGKDPNGWLWGLVHTVEHEHPIGKIQALRSFFNVGPFAIAGSKEVINNTGFSYTEMGGFKADMGPSTRRVIDFSDIEHSIGILPTGQSGNPFSNHYEDQASMYRKGAFRTLLLNKNEIEKESTILFLKPE
jgi:penicillin amidase